VEDTVLSVYMHILAQFLLIGWGFPPDNEPQRDTLTPPMQTGIGVLGTLLIVNRGE